MQRSIGGSLLTYVVWHIDWTLCSCAAHGVVFECSPVAASVGIRPVRCLLLYVVGWLIDEGGPRDQQQLSRNAGGTKAKNWPCAVNSPLLWRHTWPAQVQPRKEMLQAAAPRSTAAVLPLPESSSRRRGLWRPALLQQVHAWRA